MGLHCKAHFRDLRDFGMSRILQKSETVIAAARQVSAIARSVSSYHANGTEFGRDLCLETPNFRTMSATSVEFRAIVYDLGAVLQERPFNIYMPSSLRSFRRRPFLAPCPPPPSSPIPADRASARLPKAEPPQRTMPRKPTFGCMGALRDQSATNLGFSGLGPGRRLASSAQCAEASPVAMGQNWTAGHAPQPRGHAAATLGDEHHTSVAAEVPSRILPIRSPDLPSRPTPCRQDGLP